MEIYAVGDIHGVDVIDEIERAFNSKPNPNKYIFFLGDYIDRGGAEKQTLEKLIKLKKRLNSDPNHPRCFFLMGNHEYLMLDAIKAILAYAYAKNDVAYKIAALKTIDWWKNGGLTTILSFNPEKGINDSAFSFMQGNPPPAEDEIKRVLWVSFKKIIEYISQPDVINFFNDMYGRIDIHTTNATGKNQRFVLKHAGPAPRIDWTDFSEKYYLETEYYPESREEFKTWNRCLQVPLPSNQSRLHTVLGEVYGPPPKRRKRKAKWTLALGKKGSYHEPHWGEMNKSDREEMQDFLERRMWKNYTGQYSAYKRARPKFDTVGETINVFGHSIVDENIIQRQIAKCIRPLDAGSFMTGKVAMASLINPSVEFIRTRKTSACNETSPNDPPKPYTHLRNIPVPFLADAIENIFLPAITKNQQALSRIEALVDMCDKTLSID